MPVRKLKEYLDRHEVKYVTITHSRAYTAPAIAAAAHVPGKELAKTVMIDIDGQMAMAVLPSSLQVDLERLRDVIGADRVSLATEDDFEDLFPDCAVGAMPPFGNLWGLPVYVDASLAEDEEIAFNAGCHIELIKLPYADFERLVQPISIDMAAMV